METGEHYCLKASRLVHGIAQLPCPDCPIEQVLKVNTLNADQVCLTSCPHKIMEALLDEEQVKIFASRHITPK